MTTKELGKLIRARRMSLSLKQSDIVFASGLGGRFISDLENGKETCHIGKVLMVIGKTGQTLFIALYRAPEK